MNLNVCGTCSMHGKWEWGQSGRTELFSFSSEYTVVRGYAVAQLVEALRHKPKGRGFDYQWSRWTFSVT